jgi:hypothetical protein
MSEMGPDKTDIGGILRELRLEFARRAERTGTIEAVAGGPVDRDLPPDFWHFSDTDLENELWSRIPELDQAMLDLDQAMPELGQAMLELDQAMLDLDQAAPELGQAVFDVDQAMVGQAQAIDILPSRPLPAGAGLSGKVKGGIKNLLLRLAMPLVRITLEKQDRLNRMNRNALEKVNALNRGALERQDRLNRMNRSAMEKLNRLNRSTLEKQERLNRLNRVTLETQDRLNGLFKHLQFIQFLAVKQLRQRLQGLESENRKLRGRLAELEAENAVGDEGSGLE